MRECLCFFSSHPDSAVRSVIVNISSHGRGTDGPSLSIHLCPRGPWSPPCPPPRDSVSPRTSPPLDGQALPLHWVFPVRPETCSKMSSLDSGHTTPCLPLSQRLPNSSPYSPPPTKCLEREAHIYGSYILISHFSEI